VYSADALLVGAAPYGFQGADFPSHFPVIPTGMADPLFRSRRANVGHGAEGPWHDFKLTSLDGTKPASPTQ